MSDSKRATLSRVGITNLVALIPSSAKDCMTFGYTAVLGMGNLRARRKVAWCAAFVAVVVVGGGSVRTMQFCASTRNWETIRHNKQGKARIP